MINYQSDLSLEVEEGVDYTLIAMEHYSLQSIAAVEEEMVQYAPLEKWFTRNKKNLLSLSVEETLDQGKDFLLFRSTSPEREVAIRPLNRGLYIVGVLTVTHFDSFEALESAIRAYGRHLKILI